MAPALLLVPAALASFILAFGTGVEFVRFTSLRPLLGGIRESGGPGEPQGSRASCSGEEEPEQRGEGGAWKQMTGKPPKLGGAAGKGAEAKSETPKLVLCRKLGVKTDRVRAGAGVGFCEENQGKGKGKKGKC